MVVEASGLHLSSWSTRWTSPGAPSARRSSRRLYAPIGYRVLRVSAATGAGMGAFAGEACAGTSALVGPSGAGKSSLVNQLDPSVELRTGTVSRRDGRGRHTTVDSRLVPLACGGVVADTPGFGDVGLWGVAPEEVAACFPELEAYRDACRFRSCAHLTEPDCAVRAAVERGEMAESRYRSYVVLREEARRSVGGEAACRAQRRDARHAGARDPAVTAMGQR